MAQTLYRKFKNLILGDDLKGIGIKTNIVDVNQFDIEFNIYKGCTLMKSLKSVNGEIEIESDGKIVIKPFKLNFTAGEFICDLVLIEKINPNLKRTIARIDMPVIL